MLLLCDKHLAILLISINKYACTCLYLKKEKNNEITWSGLGFLGRPRPLFCCGSAAGVPSSFLSDIQAVST